MYKDATAAILIQTRGVQSVVSLEKIHNIMYQILEKLNPFHGQHSPTQQKKQEKSMNILPWNGFQILIIS